MRTPSAIMMGTVKNGEVSFSMDELIDSVSGSVNPEKESIEKVFLTEFDTFDAAVETVLAVLVATFFAAFTAFTATFLKAFAVFTATFFAVVKELVRLPVGLPARFDLMFELILLDETIDYDKRLIRLS